jgi:cyclophilin family peptidyl-prolyl cis-trans isomerase
MPRNAPRNAPRSSRPLVAARATVAVLLAAAGAGVALAGVSQDGATGTAPATSAAAPALNPDFSFVRMETDKGEMHILLDTPGAPLTVANFLKYVDDGFYDGTVFHRVIRDFVIQGGGFTAAGERKETRPGVRNEWQNDLKNDDYSLSMARLGGQPHSGTSQFFVNTKDNAALDTPRDGAAYAVFGIVVDGRQVVDAIEAVPTGTGTLSGRQAADVPTEPVRITRATRMTAADLSDAGRANALAWQTKYEDARGTMVERDERLERARTMLADVEPRESGLKTKMISEGEGETVPVMSTITAKYTGWMADDGWCFDTSIGKPSGDTFTAPLRPGGLIQGWIEGIALMKKGETRVFEIPAELGYGARGFPPIIPGNATLLFEVTLVDFTPPAGG